MAESTRNVCRLALMAMLMTGCDKTVEQQVSDAADRVLVNAAVYTVDDRRTWAEAVAIDEGRIVYVGDNAGAQAFVGEDTELQDLGGQLVLPGFHDSHVHILIGAFAEDECDLLRIPTMEQVVEKLQACTSLEGLGEERWVVGGGWGEWLWPEANPKKGLLDILYPDRPVILESSFGHAAWANSKALEIAGIDRDTEDPQNGIIERDPETGEPSGTLRESAMMLVDAVVPEMTLQQKMRRVRAGVKMASVVGITAIIEPGVDDELLIPIVELADLGELSLRVVASLSPLGWHAGAFDESVIEFLETREQWRRPNLDVDSVKFYMDGVIEYGTSPLLEPYADEQYGSGEYFYEKDFIDDYFQRIDEMGMQIHVHAIGDAAVRRALDGFEIMRAANGMSDNRHQIVHLQLIHPDDRPRFAELNIAAVFQSLWAYPDEAVIELDIPMLGEERTWQMYPIRSVHESGGRIVGGSDYWVTEIDPLLAIETAITRQDPWSNEGLVLNADESVDLDTMIAAYTINGAYQMNLEQEQGSIEVGKRADLAIIDRNLFEIPPSEISDAKVTQTIYDGRTVYQAEGAQ